MESYSNQSFLIKSSQIKLKFIRKLYELVQDSNIQHIVTWNEDADGIEIFNSNSFSEEVLPKYYKHKILSNFIRQLNMYKFKKVKKPNDSDGRLVYRHNFFQKSNPELIFLIDRNKCQEELDNVWKSKTETQATSFLAQSSEENLEHISCKDFAFISKKINTLKKKVEIIQVFNTELTNINFRAKEDEEITNRYIKELEIFLLNMYNAVCSSDTNHIMKDQIESRLRKLVGLPKEIKFDCVKDILINEMQCRTHGLKSQIKSLEGLELNCASTQINQAQGNARTDDLLAKDLSLEASLFEVCEDPQTNNRLVEPISDLNKELYLRRVNPQPLRNLKEVVYPNANPPYDSYFD